MRDFAEIELHKTYLLPFYDKYLNGQTHTAHDDRPEIQYAVKNTGTLRTCSAWPPPSEPMTLHLQAGPTGSVTSLNDGGLGPEPGTGSSSYSYPHAAWVLGVVALGPQGPDPARGVLTFTSAALERDVEIAGNAKLTVHVSSTRDDFDLITKLSEQFPQSPDERAKGIQPRYTIVTKGALRASHDERHETAKPIVPGQVYRKEIVMQPIAYRFTKGNRIRVEIVNGDSPVTDALFFHIYRPDKIGTDTIYHSTEHRSQLVLPVAAD
jgi:putative CocE/NonD family hydrolase